MALTIYLTLGGGDSPHELARCCGRLDLLQSHDGFAMVVSPMRSARTESLSEFTAARRLLSDDPCD